MREVDLEEFKFRGIIWRGSNLSLYRSLLKSDY